MKVVYARVGDSTQSVYFEAPTEPPEGMILMESERPLEGDYIAAEDGTWQKVIDNSIYLGNGIARQERIKREKQEKIKAEALALKKQVEALEIQFF